MGAARTGGVRSGAERSLLCSTGSLVSLFDRISPPVRHSERPYKVRPSRPGAAGDTPPERVDGGRDGGAVLRCPPVFPRVAKYLCAADCIEHSSSRDACLSSAVVGFLTGCLGQYRTLLSSCVPPSPTPFLPPPCGRSPKTVLSSPPRQRPPDLYSNPILSTSQRPAPSAHDSYPAHPSIFASKFHHRHAKIFRTTDTAAGVSWWDSLLELVSASARPHSLPTPSKSLPSHDHRTGSSS
jgi:hypothetical protein